MINIRIVNAQVDSIWQAYYDSSEVYYNIRDYDQSIELLEKAKLYIEDNYTDYKLDSIYNLTLSDLATVYSLKGNSIKAVSLFLEVEQNYENHPSQNYPLYITCIRNKANLERKLERYHDAKVSFKKVLMLAEEFYGKDHEEYGYILNDLAILNMTLASYDEALLLLLESIEIIIKTKGLNSLEYGNQLNTLATIYKLINQHEKALQTQILALETTKRILGKSNLRFARQLVTLADIYKRLKNYDKAIEIYKEAKSIIETTVGKDHVGNGTCLNNMAVTYRIMGNYKEALPLLKESVNNAIHNNGEYHSVTINRMDNLVSLLLIVGEKDEARFLLLEIMKYRKEKILKIFSISNEKNKMDLIDSFNEIFRQYYSFLYRSEEFNNLTDIFYDDELFFKSIILNNTIQTYEAIENTADNNTIKRLNDWRNLNKILADEMNKPLKARHSGFDSLLVIANIMEEELIMQSPDFMELQRNVTWQDIRKNLKSGEVAIEFVHFNYRIKNWTDSTIYAAMLILPDSENPIWIDLFEEKELVGLFDKANLLDADKEIIAYLYNPKKRHDVTNKNLYQLIWKPLEPYLKNNQKVHFSSSGLLHKIAFAALKDHNDIYLHKRYQLNQLSSTRSIVLPDPDPIKFNLSTASIYGDITYSYDSSYIANIADSTKTNEITGLISKSDTAEVTLRSSIWTSLAGAKIECNEISTIFQKRKVDKAYYKREFATEALFKKQEGKLAPTIIHLATHGYSFSLDANQKDQEQIITGYDLARYSINPLSRAGVVLANGNYMWTTGKRIEGREDGILTALEISRLDLGGTYLVVLSACNTALGDIHNSEGVFGLQRTLKMAGVDYIIASLWLVDDDATAKFMISFYKHWTKKKNIHDAFRKTQLEMSKIYENEVYKWAAFVLIE